MDEVQHVVLAGDQVLDVLPIERGDPGGPQRVDQVVEDLVSLVLLPFDLDGEFVPLGMFEQLEKQRCRPIGGCGVTAKGGKEILVGRLGPKHDSVLPRYTHIPDSLRVR